jgi:hypothetical protein
MSACQIITLFFYICLLVYIIFETIKQIKNEENIYGFRPDFIIGPIGFLWGKHF